MKEQVREEPRIMAAAEKQMRSWAKQEELSQTFHRVDPSQVGVQIGPYVAISRQAGAGGSQLGQALGEQLGWEVFDKSLLEQIAERLHVPKRMLELVDETESSWVYDVLGVWMDSEIIPHEKYVAHLCRVALAAARRGKAIFVGRGVSFLLPPQNGLTVRLIAPIGYRVQRMRELKGLSCSDARAEVERLDRGRREFVQRYFHHDIDDPQLYDLVINVARMGPERTLETVLAAMPH